MKKLTYLLTAGLLLAILILSGCKKDDDGGPTVEEEQLAALDGTWTATSVADDAGARADYFDPAFKLIIDSDNRYYSTENGPDKLPFPPEGTFALGAANAVTSLMILNNDYEVNYEISTDGLLTLTISNYNGSGYDNVRTESVVGSWTFVFDK